MSLIWFVEMCFHPCCSSRLCSSNQEMPEKYERVQLGLDMERGAVSQQERGLFDEEEEETDQLLHADDPRYSDLCQRLVHFADMTSDHKKQTQDGDACQEDGDEIACLRSRLAHSEALIAALRHNGDYSNNNAQIPVNSSLVDALTLDFHRFDHDVSQQDHTGTISEDNILNGGTLDEDECDFVEGVWSRGPDSTSCPHLPPSYTSYLTCSTQTDQRADQRRAPQLVNQRQSTYNTSTGSSTSGVEVSSVSSRSDYLLPPPFRTSGNKNVLIVETACTPPGEAGDLHDPLSLYRSSSFKSAIERGHSGDSSNQSFETYDPPSTSSDISPEHTTYPYLTITDRLDYNYISHRLSTPTSRGRNAKKHKQTTGTTHLPPEDNSSFVSTAGLVHQSQTYLQNKLPSESRRQTPLTTISRESGGPESSESLRVHRVYGNTDSMLNDAHYQYRITQSNTAPATSRAPDAASDASTLHPIHGILRHNKADMNGERSAPACGADAETTSTVEQPQLEAQDSSESPNRSRRLSTLVEEECSEADGDEHRSSRHHHHNSAIKHPPYPNKTSAGSASVTSPPVTQGMPLKRWVLSPPTPPKYKNPPPYTEVLSAESSPATSHREIVYTHQQRSRSLSPKSLQDTELKIFPGSTSPVTSPPVTPQPKTGSSSPSLRQTIAENRVTSDDSVRTQGNVSYIGRARRKSLKENRKQKVKDMDDHTGEHFSDHKDECILHPSQSEVDAGDVDAHRKPSPASRRSRERAVKRSGSGDLPRNLPSTGEVEDEVFEGHRETDKSSPHLGTLQATNSLLQIGTQAISNSKAASRQTTNSLQTPANGASLPFPITSEPVVAGFVEVNTGALVPSEHPVELPDSHTGGSKSDVTSFGVASNTQLERIKQENLARKRNLSKQTKMPELSETSETESAKGGTQSTESADSETEANAAAAAAAKLSAHQKPDMSTYDIIELNPDYERGDDSATANVEENEAGAARTNNTSAKSTADSNNKRVSPAPRNGDFSKSILNKEPKAFPSLPDKVLASLGLQSSSNDHTVIEQLSEQEVEEKFARVSLAFKTDKLTLDKRIERHKRSRDIMEQNIETEIQNLKDTLKAMSSLCLDKSSRDVYSQVQQHVDVLEQSSNRMASRAELLGAVQQELRISQAIEVMVQHVDNLKRMYEKEHIELEETKRLLLENRMSHSTDGGDGARRLPFMGGAPGAKAGRRRASVAVLSNNNRPLLVTQTSHNCSPLTDLDAISRAQFVANSSASAFRRASLAATSSFPASSLLSSHPPDDILHETPIAKASLDLKDISTPEISDVDIHRTQVLNDATEDTASTHSTASEASVIELPAITVKRPSVVESPTPQLPPESKTDITPSSSRRSRSPKRSASTESTKRQSRSPSLRRGSPTPDKETPKANSAIARDMFRKGFEQGLRAHIHNDLEDFKKEQDEFQSSLKDYMDAYAASNEDEAGSLIERLWMLLPGWENMGQTLRLGLAGFMMLIGLIFLVLAIFPSLAWTVDKNAPGFINYRWWPFPSSSPPQAVKPPL